MKYKPSTHLSLSLSLLLLLLLLLSLSLLTTNQTTLNKQKRKKWNSATHHPKHSSTLNPKTTLQRDHSLSPSLLFSSFLFSLSFFSFLSLLFFLLFLYSYQT